MFARISVTEFGAIPLNAVRSVIAALTLTPLMFIYGQWQAFRDHWPHFIVLGLISTALPFTLLTISTQFSTAGFASILNALTPILSAAIAWAWLKEHLSRAAVIGIGLSFVGVVFMISDTQSISAEFFLLPVLAGFGAALFYAITGNYARKFAAQVPPIAQSAGCQIFSAIFMVPPAFFLWPEQSISTQGWINAAVLGLMCTSLAFILYFYLLQHIGVAKTVIVTYLIPVFGMLWGYLFLDEVITLNMFTSAGLILTGVALTTGLIKRADN